MCGVRSAGTQRWRRYNDRPGGRVAAFSCDDKSQVMEPYPDAVADVVVPRGRMGREPRAPPSPQEVGVHSRGVHGLGDRPFPFAWRVPDQLRAPERTPPRYSADDPLDLQNIGGITPR